MADENKTVVSATTKRSSTLAILIILGISTGIAAQIFVGYYVASLQVYLIDQTLGSGPHLIITSN